MAVFTCPNHFGRGALAVDTVASRRHSHVAEAYVVPPTRWPRLLGSEDHGVLGRSRSSVKNPGPHARDGVDRPATGERVPRK